MEYYLQVLIGGLVLIAVTVPLSDNYKQIKVKNIFFAILMMFVFAFILLNDFVNNFFEALSNGVAKLSSATAEGTSFLFGSLFEAHPYIFALNVLPLIIVMSCISALLWHWRVLPLIIKGLSYVCERLFNLGGPVSFGAAANVFVGQVEAPLFVRPYLKTMSNKELLILMTAGMATVSGSVMIALAGQLENQFEGLNVVQHFLTASILSVPAAIMYAEIMSPSADITHNLKSSEEKNIYQGSMDAITRGTRDGLGIAVNVAAIVLAVLALVSIVDGFLSIFGDISLQKILGYIFAPICWLMGVPWNESANAAELLGIKLATNEFVAYIQFGSLDPEYFTERTKVILLYALCGFANFSSVGILISGIGAMAPERRIDLIKVSGKALIGATLASCMSGLVAGIFV
ncbi:MAG: nucleoside transporter C-terminal domain-containing protein [Pseudomonadota bacterium]|jgi:CNT family concentrative nucleoside transporter|uniref:Na+-dependent nucleoside transporter n=1 Tax=SAR86 cluster bacterium TaxID=2030880 RepID=A0A9Q8X4P1_9GAMM|nr:Na+-dependent nucleoside transporter [bacterium]MEC7809192.1 nucleoside transporter C-terminal domain-containing protein [Pseudomonadota bacterium]URQ63661.1 Na+-dependent nucleoside transporter [SAR86 cluster bacterium]|tara:strand:- start:49 stop:1257 length:1209 start_codon:yes stop_codon:yes gene_type:complete